jgi:hypothetical protein
LHGSLALVEDYRVTVSLIQKELVNVAEAQNGWRNRHRLVNGVTRCLLRRGHFESSSSA